MVFGNIKDRKAFDWLSASLQVCLSHMEDNDMPAYENGRHDIDGDSIYVNVMEYETTQPENRIWEAHRQYLDVHVVLSGEEQLDTNFISNMQQKEYVPADDFLPLEGDKNASAILRPGDFLICWPEDAHRTAIAVNGPVKVKKAVFKVKL